MQLRNFSWLAGTVVALLASACTAATPTAPTPSYVTLAQAQALFQPPANPASSSLPLWNIQPGLGTIMMEYRTRFSNVYYAVDKNNWNMAQYQVQEMTEIQEVGETTRPGRKAMLVTYENTYLDPLLTDITNKDKTKFNSDYTAAINGCNACHAASSTSDFANLGFIAITAPATSDYPNVNWAGQ